MPTVPVPIQCLPPEILNSIFQRTIPPTFLLDVSLYAGPHSPWFKATKIKKSIILVCRSWYTIGIRFLYEDIVLQRPHQIPAFVRTLDTSSLAQDFGYLVKSINICTYIPPEFSISFNKHLTRIMDNCPRLQQFNFSPPFKWPFTAPNPILSWSITSLSLNDSFPFAIVLRILGAAGGQLRHLGMHAPPSSVVSGTERLCYLPYLLSLQIYFRTWEGFSISFFVDVLCIPRIKHLTLRSVGQFEASFFLPILEKHGPKLCVLQLHTENCMDDVHNTDFEEHTDGQILLDLCPGLEHLVIESTRAMVGLSHPNIQWLDVWIPGDVTPSWRHRSEILAGFRACRGLREIHSVLMHLFDIATLLPPDMVATDLDTFEIAFPGACVRHGVGRLDLARRIDVDSWDVPTYDTDSGAILESDCTSDWVTKSDDGESEDDGAQSSVLSYQDSEASDSNSVKNLKEDEALPQQELESLLVSGNN
ncbi:hypothetical protein H0H81_011623 [Sphagnurus paluster]|uniref:F-box domain-containing protein n=1 Tax=Sphagnurus paluster TaxID=117069 RepID=A0A9P7GP40_9AGAR|nr:hypothetical protein H0H81_011623 [Sphagnurus paluster]